MDDGDGYLPDAGDDDDQVIVLTASQHVQEKQKSQAKPRDRVSELRGSSTPAIRRDSSLLDIAKEMTTSQRIIEEWVKH